MNKRPFWVRSATPEGATPLDSGLAARTLMWQYPGCMGALSVFHLTLTEGYSPHDLHVHPFEQMVVVLSGRLDLRSSEGDHPLGPRSAFRVPVDVPAVWRLPGAEPSARVRGRRI
jgi:hypothetical protein